jgi:hypothetical protein
MLESEATSRQYKQGVSIIVAYRTGFYLLRCFRLQMALGVSVLRLSPVRLAHDIGQANQNNFKVTNSRWVPYTRKKLGLPLVVGGGMGLLQHRVEQARPGLLPTLRSRA